MLTSGTTTLDQILMIGSTTKGHEGLSFKEEILETKTPAPINVVPIRKITIIKVVRRIIRQEDKDLDATNAKS